MIRGIDFKKIIKITAQKCLDEKWTIIRDSEINNDYSSIDNAYEDDCAFCILAKAMVKHFLGTFMVGDRICEFCLCPKELCCHTGFCDKNGDSTLMVKCLKHLSKCGILSEKLLKELNNCD